MTVRALEIERVARAKRAFTTRRVGVGDMQNLIYGTVRPASGDLVLARVTEIGKQKRIELTDGRRAHLFPGDEIIVCYGNRYAPDQFEAVIGDDLGSCDLIAAGGVASRELSRNERMAAPTRIAPIGLIGDCSGNRLNVRDYSIPETQGAPSIPVILSFGTSMNAGKTLTATSLVRSLKSAGHRVAAIKATGTGSGGDLWITRDAGADVVLDFTDAGFASTYLIPVPDIEAAIGRLVKHAAGLGCTVAVLEVADGLQHVETAMLAQSKNLWSDSIGVVFSAYDAMGAKCGVDMLKAMGHRVLALSGRLTQSPLAIREAERATGLRAYTPWELQDGSLTAVIMEAEKSSELGNIASLPSYQSEKTAAIPANGLRKSQHTNNLIDGRAWRHRNTANSYDVQAKHTAPEDGLRDVLRFVAEWVMAVEISTLCGAGLRARSPQRTNRRSGYRSCRWATALGQIDIKVPKLRKGRYCPIFLTPSFRHREDIATLVRDVSRRSAAAISVRRLLEAMGGASLSEHEISSLSSEILLKAVPNISAATNGNYEPQIDGISDTSRGGYKGNDLARDTFRVIESSDDEEDEDVILSPKPVRASLNVLAERQMQAAQTSAIAPKRSEK